MTISKALKYFKEKRKVARLNYLEEELKLAISIIEEGNNTLPLKDEIQIFNNKGQIVTVVKKIALSVFVFRILPILLPAKTVELINDKIRVEIRHNEHPPPHFHIIIDNEDYAIEILTGNYLHNEVKNSRYRKAIKKWHISNKNLLIKTWNATRPTNCTVGKI